VDKNKVYQGTVRTGRGGAVKEMSGPDFLEGFRMFSGLEVIPGTLNIHLVEPFDLSLLKYLRFADIGWDFDPATQGIEFEGETGVHWGRTTIVGKYPGCILFFTWTSDVYTKSELVSPHHLRTVLGLNDGDVVEFTLAD